MMKKREKTAPKTEAAKSKYGPYVFQVSTKPDITSYKWIGKEFSILSAIVLWTLWLCRILSVYQHIKALVRIIGGALGRNNTDNPSGRPNIPPMLGEIYFILWTTVFSLMHIFQWEGLGFRLLATYYLFESCVWIFYYTVFRRFFEIGYSIYHKLEYLTAIILIIPTQALCFAHLYDRRFQDMLVGLLGAARDDTPVLVAVLGCLFAAIVISMIISTFPMEAIKEPDTRPSMFVIGCGDVVKKRLYPAIQDSACTKKTKVYDLLPVAEEETYCTYLDSPGNICLEIEKEITENDIIWIETPSYAHVSYLKQFMGSKAKLIVVEKPISIRKEELPYVEELLKHPEKRNKLFFLSYYMLEKALPLYYLTHFNEMHEKYLDIDDESIIKNWKMLLGALESAKVHICEGTDTRGWVYQDENGGQLLETFLHNMLIASLLCGEPHTWTEVNYVEADTPGGECAISLSAKCNHADIDLFLKKNAPEEELCRYGEFRFAHGTIEVDFETKMAKIYFRELDKYSTISIKQEYSQRYSVLVDMVACVANGTCKSREIDGLINQIPTIKWLLELKEQKADGGC